MQVVLIIIILIIIFAIIILCASNKQQITNFLISTNPMYYQGSLYWMDLILGNQTFRVLLDTGSNLVIIAGDTCNTCQSGATLPVNKNDPGDLTASYGGGQQIRYNNESMYAPQFGKNINVSVISSGTFRSRSMTQNSSPGFSKYEYFI